MSQVSNRCRSTFRYAGLMFGAFGLLLQACDQPAGFMPLRSLEVVQEDPLVQHFVSDNPIVAGFMKPLPDMLWAAQEVDLSFQDLDTTGTMWWRRFGEPQATVRALASVPIFVQGFKIAGWGAGYTRGNAEANMHVPRLVTSTTPWLGFPTDCAQLSTSGDCARYADKTFPFVVGNMRLPANHQPFFMGLMKQGSSSSELLHLTQGQLHPDVIAVPVHVHVFLDPDTSGVEERDWVRQRWDPGYVDRFALTASDGTIINWTSFNQAPPETVPRPWTLTANLEPCRVQVQLESFEMLHQTEGLEDEKMVMVGNSTGASECADTSGSILDQPFFDYFSQARHNVAQARANGHAVRQGPHVFLGGDVQIEDANNPGTPQSSDGVRGLGCDLDDASHIGGPFAVAENSVNRNANLRHEMLHVFGLEHPPNNPGGGDFADIDTATMGSSLCNKVRSFASRMAEL